MQGRVARPDLHGSFLNFERNHICKYLFRFIIDSRQPLCACEANLCKPGILRQKDSDNCWMCDEHINNRIINAADEARECIRPG
eukprot:SAG31_NODE_2376_length_5841_cov_10.199060_8_plen_84_part_00